MNALCGRAHYGETTGTIYINGKKTDIEECKDATGFVPQDDIMYAELTVKENLMFAGKIRLPHGTSHSDIEDLADEVIADLGLTRVSSSIVGDVTRRGVSGGEKKRVNIGLELMSKPSILFLDEPTRSVQEMHLNSSHIRRNKVSFLTFHFSIFIFIYSTNLQWLRFCIRHDCHGIIV